MRVYAHACVYMQVMSGHLVELDINNNANRRTILPLLKLGLRVVGKYYAGMNRLVFGLHASILDRSIWNAARLVLPVGNTITITVITLSPSTTAATDTTNTINAAKLSPPLLP